MNWEDILKKKPSGYYKTSERKKRKKAKDDVIRLKKKINVLKDRRDSLQRTYDDKKNNEKVKSQRNIKPIKYIKEGNRRREATKKEQSDYLERAYAKQEKEFIDFERKFKSKIHSLDNEIKQIEAKLKEMK
tara:strand:- start:269 stop:661 length:393 start_codon:yes stop_codon:yes gene_type:complete